MLTQLMFSSHFVTGPSPTDVSLSWIGLLHHKNCSLSMPGYSLRWREEEKDEKEGKEQLWRA